tara:strand:- start:3606 stop:4637 length:1032 start_codon:yes stop_codon:yes gene_type:complete
MAFYYGGILEGIMAADAKKAAAEDRRINQERYDREQARADERWALTQEQFGFTKDQAAQAENIRRSESALKLLKATGFDEALTNTAEFKSNILYLGNALGDTEGASDLIADLSRNPTTLSTTTKAIKEMQKKRGVNISPEELIEGIEVISENADDPDFMSRLEKFKDLRTAILMGSLQGLSGEQYSDTISKLAELGQYTPPSIAVNIDPALYGGFDPAVLKRQQTLFNEGVLSLANQALNSVGQGSEEYGRISNEINNFKNNPIPLQNRFGYFVTQQLKDDPNNAYLFEQKTDPSISKYTIPPRAIEILVNEVDPVRKQQAINDFNEEYGQGMAEYFLNPQSN